MILDENKLQRSGWAIECSSPLELRHRDGSFAAQRAAQIVAEAVHGANGGEWEPKRVWLATDGALLDSKGWALEGMGWKMVSGSKIELTDDLGSKATGLAAWMVLEYLRSEVDDDETVNSVKEKLAAELKTVTAERDAALAQVAALDAIRCQALIVCRRVAQESSEMGSYIEASKLQEMLEEFSATKGAGG